MGGRRENRLKRSPPLEFHWIHKAAGSLRCRGRKHSRSATITIDLKRSTGEFNGKIKVQVGEVDVPVAGSVLEQ
jgi:hypothetical protein